MQDMQTPGLLGFVKISAGITAAFMILGGVSAVLGGIAVIAGLGDLAPLMGVQMGGPGGGLLAGLLLIVYGLIVIIGALGLLGFANGFVALVQAQIDTRNMMARAR